MKVRLALVLLLAQLFVAGKADASGLYFAERGTHGLGRAGAYVAGARGLDAIGYNPAGLRGTGLLGDFTLLLLDVRYQRELEIVDSAGVTQRVMSPVVNGRGDLIPFPTMIAAYSPEHSDFTLAGGLYTPTFALVSFPSEVDGKPSPGRYALSGFTDSRLVLAGAFLSYHPNDAWSFGLGMHALLGTFRSSIAFTLSLPDRLLAAPEDPDYDALGRISVGPFVAPSGTAGVQYAPLRSLRFGLSGDLPTWVDSDARFEVRLPDSAVFDTVDVRGQRAHVRMRLPAVLRAGVEIKPIERLAIELAYVREFWSLHDRISITPRDVSIQGIPGGPDSLALPSLEVVRKYRDASSYRLGAELTGSLRGHDYFLRSGIAYEQSAVPQAYLSLSSLDFDKVVLSFGAGAFVTPRLRLDLAFAHLVMSITHVTPREAKLTRIYPFTGNAPTETVNGGRYRAHANLLSAGFSYAFR